MLQLARRIPLGVDVGELLQFQGALECSRVSRVAADEQEVARARVPLGQLANLSVQPDGPRDLIRQPAQVLDHLGDLVGEHGPPDLRQVQRQEVEHDHLRGERLRRGDADLRPGVRVQDAVGLPRDRRTHSVGDGDDVRVLLARVTDRLQRVDGLT